MVSRPFRVVSRLVAIQERPLPLLAGTVARPVSGQYCSASCSWLAMQPDQFHHQQGSPELLPIMLGVRVKRYQSSYAGVRYLWSLVAPPRAVTSPPGTTDRAILVLFVEGFGGVVTGYIDEPKVVSGLPPSTRPILQMGTRTAGFLFTNITIQFTIPEPS